MKKTLIVLAIIITILSINKEEKIIIPKEAIRFRIIANSNNYEDQQIKKEIIKELTETIEETENRENIKDMRNYINVNLPKYTEIVEKTLKAKNNNTNFHINYGKNYFPEKEYKNVIYKAGEYESLVITLGAGEGENFWCVLFPPLCLIDENKEEYEYKSIIKEIINKYF